MYIINYFSFQGGIYEGSQGCAIKKKQEEEEINLLNYFKQVLIKVLG